MTLPGHIAVAVVVLALGVLIARRRANARGRQPGSPPHTELLDPHELLFSIPTLNDLLPPVDREGVFGGNAALMHEDDWRQEEFLSIGNRHFVEDTLLDLARHRAVHAQGPGFREVLVRREPPVPLIASKLRAASLSEVVGAVSAPLFFSGNPPARIRDGFAIPLPDVGFLYGTTAEGLVTALGLGLVGSGLGDVTPIAELSRTYELLFVDWIRGTVIEPGDTAGFRAWLDAIVYQDPGEAI